jgi:hypothetical protein
VAKDEASRQTADGVARSMGGGWSARNEYELPPPASFGAPQRRNELLTPKQTSKVRRAVIWVMKQTLAKVRRAGLWRAAHSHAPRRFPAGCTAPAAYRPEEPRRPVILSPPPPSTDAGTPGRRSAASQPDNGEDLASESVTFLILVFCVHFHVQQSFNLYSNELVPAARGCMCGLQSSD